MKRPLFFIILFISAVMLLPQSAKAQLQWTVVTPAPTSDNLNSVTYGNGQYVAVGSSSTILTSPDGIVWTKRRLIDTTLSLNFKSIAYGNGMFVAVSSIYYYEVEVRHGWYIGVSIIFRATSTDGITWTTGTVGGSSPAGFPPNGKEESSVSFDNGSFVASFYPAGYVRFQTSSSTDGVSWVEGGNLSYPDMSDNRNKSMFVNGLFVILGANGRLLVSWTARSSGTTRYLSFSTYGSGQYVVVGDSGTILTSPDDSIWTIQPTGINNNLKSVTYGSGQYVAVGSGGTIINSPDVINWALNSSGTTNTLNSVTTNGGGQFVAVGNSGTIVFTTIPPAPATPALVFPADSVLDQPISLDFIWNHSARAASYHIQIATDTGFTNMFLQDSARTDSVRSVNGLIPATTYYWRVRAKNAGGTSAWSEVRSFTTMATAVLPRPPSLLPTTFTVSGSSGIVRYSLPKACHISLKYYDLRGRLVASLINATQGAGYYTLSIKDAFPSRGTYIRVFEAGNFIKRDLTAVVGK